jgi:hypothetical protein
MKTFKNFSDEYLDEGAFKVSAATLKRAARMVSNAKESVAFWEAAVKRESRRSAEKNQLAIAKLRLGLSKESLAALEKELESLK